MKKNKKVKTAQSPAKIHAETISNKGSGVRFYYKPGFQLFSIIIIGILLYCYTLPYPFIFDDRGLIQGNPLVMESSGFLDLLDLDEFGSKYISLLNEPDMVSNFAMRPVVYFTFRLNYLLGGMDPSGFRAVNIAIHIANAVMFYLFLKILIQQRNETAGVTIIPLFATFIFLVHPLQTESVTYITQRFTSMGTGVYLITMLFYLMSDTDRPLYLKRLFYLASIATLIIGMFTKEFVFTVPFSLLLMSLILMRKTFRTSVIRLAPHLACLAIIPMSFQAVSKGITEKTTDPGFLKMLDFYGYSSLEYAITQLRVILSYFRMLVLPYGLNIDPDYPLFRSFANPEILLSIMVWGIFLSAGIVLLKKANRSIEDDLTLFSLVWFPLLISVSSSVVPLPDLMAEHRTYLPSLAFCTGIVSHIYALRHRLKPVWMPRIATAGCLLMALFCLLTVQRNRVYSSRLSLWSDTVSKSPMKARPALALGNIYLEEKQFDGAIEWLSKAVKLGPDFLDAHLSLGSLFHDMSMPNNAIDLYESYLGGHPPERRILYNLSLAYYNTGNFDQAIDTMQRAIKLDGDDERQRLVLAEYYYCKGLNQMALKQLDRVAELDRENPLVDYSEKIEMLRQRYGKHTITETRYNGRVAS